MRYLTFVVSLGCSFFVAGWLVAADQSDFPGDGYRCIGKIAPRDARDIHGSNWSVGAETMDRDFTVYKNWRQYLGPLGVKHARIQSGWAKTEKEKGVYDWAWLDEIVDDMVAQGVTPWVCICYGNPIYPKGGGIGLPDGWPRGEEALAAWDRYVAALVKRYQSRVVEWEIWNEPGLLLKKNAKTDLLQDATDYADFFIRTANVVRREQPTARILGLALPKMPLPYAERVLERLKEKNALGLLDELTYHPYNVNPDASYDTVEELRTMLRSYAPRASIRQGENGCPSAKGGFGALAGARWNETGQAKWALRRLLGDLGRDIPSSYFSICDMAYPDRINHKGLLAINEDKTVHHAKEAYYAVQNLTAIFDDTVQRVRKFTYEIEGGDPGSTYSVFAYRKNEANMLALWRNNDRPGANARVEHVTITLPPAMGIVTPVLVDLRTGEVYKGPVEKEPRVKMTLRDVPVYDSPIVLAHLRGLPFAPPEDLPSEAATRQGSNL
jgi:hypothetical protein